MNAWAPFVLLGQSYEFVPLEWLKKWLDDSTAIKEIDNSQFLCSHGKLHPDNIGEVKRISSKAADLLFGRYGGISRLSRKTFFCQIFYCSLMCFIHVFIHPGWCLESSLCRDCVTQRCRVIRLKNQLNEDYREVMNLAKAPLKRYECFFNLELQQVLLLHSSFSTIDMLLWSLLFWI